jgi:hypothetical protein
MTTGVPPLPAALAALAGVRERAVDEHMFRLPEHAPWRATFRVQLFTAPGLRPVAIAIQTPLAGEGTSLTTAAEACAGAVWQQYCPDESEPPVWITHLILDENDTLGGSDLELVTFTADPAARTLADPEWLAVSARDVDALVGQHVDLDRGSGFVPPEIEPDPESTYVAQLVVLLPRPSPFRADDCMAAGVPWWRRLGRQIVPRRGGRDCCWYHGGDWENVNQFAIRLVEQAQRDGLPSADTAAYVLDHPDVQRLTTWEREALYSLMAWPIRPYAPWPRRQGYNNGQHRAQAMLDAGVRRILIARD